MTKTDPVRLGMISRHDQITLRSGTLEMQFSLIFQFMLRNGKLALVTKIKASERA